MKTIECFRCKEELPTDRFYQRKNRTGDSARHKECIRCFNTRNVARVANIKLKSVKYLGGKCEKCGYDKNPKALDFHHKDPTQKDFTFATKKNKSFEGLKSELDKCILLCANCHREEHDHIWRESNTVNWDLYNEMVNYDEWPNLKQQTYQARFGVKPNCIDCGINLNTHNTLRCHTCHSKLPKTTKAQYPSKEVLANLVWEKPTTMIAKELGVSDKAVEKRCKKLGIEKPPPGYWTQKKFGKI